MVSKEERYEGMWWVTSCPEKIIFGTLNVTSECIWLDLYSTLGENQNHWSEHSTSYEIILGIQSCGYRFTLEKCVEDRNEISLNGGYPTQRFVVNQVYGRIHVKNVDELKISSRGLKPK